MSTSQPSESPLLRFLDSFLQEKNIKWVLATGLLILLGSSLMMVSKGWTDFDPTCKFLVILGYTTAVFVAGRWCHDQLALRKTGTVLMALTVLMIPATFVAWHWLWSSVESTGARGVAGGLLVLNTGLAAFAARRIFAHFLRGHQITFVICFLLLSLAGAVAPAVATAGPVWSWLSAFGLWAIFSVGVVKVNRHVFWLTEEHRQPRIFGFFPILLLGGQFLFVFAANFAMRIPADWFGLACVLVAVPVLLTADSVARVFQERTGDIVRPIPWPIMLPLCAGIVLCIGGIGLAASRLATEIPYAIVPTAALAAALMGVVARRTQRRAFVWAMLGGVLLAYNFSPVFFQELARTAIQQGARAVDEDRLPYAFYGLTYLPLIIASLAAATWTKSRGHELYAGPLRQFVVGLAALLLVVSVGHAKALVPVALLMAALFVAMARLLADRRLVLPGLTALLMAAAGAASFADSAWDVSLPGEAHYIAPLAAATALLLCGPWLDRRFRGLPIPGKFLATSQLVQAPALTFSLAATILTSLPWLFRWNLPDVGTWWPAALIAGLMLAHSLVWVRPATSWACVAFVLVEGIHCGLDAGLSVWLLADLATVGGLAAWGATYLFDARPAWRVSRAWVDVGRWSALIVLALTTLVFAMPGMLLEIIDSHLLPDAFLWWPCYALLTAWCFDAARRTCQLWTTCLGCASGLVLASWMLVEFAGQDSIHWLPVAWAVTAVAAVPVVEWLRRYQVQMEGRIVTVDAYRGVQAIVGPTTVIVRGLLILLAGASLAIYDRPLTVAGVVALAGLAGWATARRVPRALLATALLANWLAIILGARWFAPADQLIELVFELSKTAACVVAVMAAASTLGWQVITRQVVNRYFPLGRDVATVHIAMLRCATGFGLLATLPQSAVSPGHIGLATMAFLLSAGSEFWCACLRGDVRRVWTGLAVLTAAFAYFGWFDVLHFGSGLALFLPLVIGGGLSLAATLARRQRSTELLAGPFSTVGLHMPLLTVAIALGRHVAWDDRVVWLGTNSLALLATSGFYFWHAVERRSKWFALLSAGIFNVALMLLFRELSFSDPQFYLIPVGASILLLVEVLKREIPEAWHNPLRYAGALVILVSPTFHIIGDSWLPMLSLMISSTAVLLVAIGLRVRALMYAGTAFLVADLAAMVVRGGIEHPNLLWIVGLGFGAAVLTLGAVLENNREKMLQRLRSLSAQLEQWS